MWWDSNDTSLKFTNPVGTTTNISSLLSSVSVPGPTGPTGASGTNGSIGPTGPTGPTFSSSYDRIEFTGVDTRTYSMVGKPPGTYMVFLYLNNSIIPNVAPVFGPMSWDGSSTGGLYVSVSDSSFNQIMIISSSGSDLVYKCQLATTPPARYATLTIFRLN
jgi:hypothetical protein